MSASNPPPNSPLINKDEALDEILENYFPLASHGFHAEAKLLAANRVGQLIMFEGQP